ncbi:PrsW family intramembrane metalloprotease [Granulicoccus sp. GXG6511]|uniref:PrsW family intramembrane metalloprotease n=1 Tax=Granulicoccus sp. GXG6511 TaxID=3381351 RepID=UPI003D7E998B
MSQPSGPGAIAPMGQSPVPHGRLPQWPVLRKKQVFVVPIIAIAVGALVMGLLIALQVITAPTQALFGLFISALAAIVGILLLTWLDRWEPEPPHLLISAFFWGGGVSLLFLVFAYPVAQAVGGDGAFFTAAIAAPLLEESAKGLFLVIVMLTTRRGRAEFNSLTDAVVYAGFIGIGFTFIEDIGYIAGQTTVGEAIGVAALRIGLGAWLHSIFTAMTAIGLWLGVTSRGPLRFLYPFFGWCVAVLLHAIHNGSSFFGIGAFFAAILLVMLPATIAIIVLAVRSHRREGEIFRGQLPAMVYNGWVTPQEANWLTNLRSRRLALSHAKTQGKHERARVAAFRDHVTELAYVRNRLDRMGPPFAQELVHQHDDLVRLIEADKQWVAEHLQPVPQGWHEVPPTPGQDYLPESFDLQPPPPGGPPPIDPDATRIR